MWTIVFVIFGLGFVVAALLGLIYFIGYMANHHPDTALGRICKAINSFIERLPED